MILGVGKVGFKYFLLDLFCRCFAVVKIKGKSLLINSVELLMPIVSMIFLD